MRLSSHVGTFAQHVPKEMYPFHSEIRVTCVKADAKFHTDCAARLAAVKRLNLLQLMDYVANDPLWSLTTLCHSYLELWTFTRQWKWWLFHCAVHAGHPCNRHAVVGKLDDGFQGASRLETHTNSVTRCFKSSLTMKTSRFALCRVYSMWLLFWGTDEIVIIHLGWRMNSGNFPWFIWKQVKFASVDFRPFFQLLQIISISKSSK